MMGTVYRIRADGEFMEAWIMGEKDTLPALVSKLPMGWTVKEVEKQELGDFYTGPPFVLLKSTLGKKSIFRFLSQSSG